MADANAMARFLANGGQKLPPKPKRETPSPKREPMKRGKGPAQQSFKQKLLNARWAGAKDDRIEMMKRYDPDGPHCEFCGVPGNDKTLDFHHLVRRGQGGSYAARNGALACNRFNVHGPNNCHDKEDGNAPAWTKGTA